MKYPQIILSATLPTGICGGCFFTSFDAYVKTALYLVSDTSKSRIRVNLCLLRFGGFKSKKNQPVAV